MIIYTDKLIPAGKAACTRGPIIFIRPQYKGDLGLLEHERTHVRQWWRTCGWHSLWYASNKKYRYQSEIEAYREQLKFSPQELLTFAVFIVDKYGLDVELEKVMKDLRG